MKLRRLIGSVPLLAAIALLSACSIFTNPGDSLGGGGTADYTPSQTTSTLGAAAKEAVGELSEGAPSVPAGATEITQSDFSDGSYSIETSGDYYIASAIEGKLNVKKKDVTLYLYNASLSAENGKVINCTKKNFTITLIGSNTVTGTATSDANAKNAIGCDEDVTINGTGSLTVISAKNGISASTVRITEATLNITAAKDGIHAEPDYDALTEAPAFSYEEGGYVCLDGASVTINAADDGIQADTFVYITGETALNITANGGAPSSITERSADAADGKGVKAGPIDWGANDSEIEGDYLILLESGTVNVNSNDDAIHSDHTVEICGGTLTIAAGDDGLHADELLTISGGTVSVSRCYEGVESAKVEISGGTVVVNATDDGINAADGTQNSVNQANNNCHIIISGGEVTVNASGDGIDSNGSMLISDGYVFVSGPTSGANAALDADGSIIVNGGYLFAVGCLGMVETPASNSGQNVVSFAQNSSVKAGTLLSLTDSEGEMIFYYETPKACQSVILSCPELTKGSSYCIYGGSTKLCSFTVSSTITTVGSSASITNPGSTPGGGMGGIGGGIGGRR